MNTPALTLPDSHAPTVLAALEWKFRDHAVGLFFDGDQAAYAALSQANKYRALMRVFFKELYADYVKAFPADELDVT